MPNSPGATDTPTAFDLRHKAQDLSEHMFSTPTLHAPFLSV